MNLDRSVVCMRLSGNALRWLFLIEGWLLVLIPVNALGIIRRSIQLAVRDGYLTAEQSKPVLGMLALFVAVMATIGVLCLVSAWGLKRDQAWAKWTGMAASILQLPFFPVGTILGGLGLWGCWSWHADLAAPAHKAAGPAGDAAWIQGLRQILSFGLLIYLSNRMYAYAQTIGLQPANLGSYGIVYLLAGQYIETLLHELGHLGAALAVGFRFKKIQVGPFSVSTDARGRRNFAFDTRLLFYHGGFLASIPKSEEHVRSNMMIVVAAGPVTSLLCGMLLFLGMLSAPGTGMARYGEFLGYGAVIFLLDFVINLVPVGYCDGSMLLGLALKNKRGNKIMASLLSAMHGHEAVAAPHSGDVEKQIEATRKALDAAVSKGGEETLQTAQSLLLLGHAEMKKGAAAEAEPHVTRGLAILEKNPSAPPLLLGGAYEILALLYYQTGRKKLGDEAGAKAIPLIDQSKEQAKDREILLELHDSIATLRMKAGYWREALEETQLALGVMPAGRKHVLIAGRLHRTQAICYLNQSQDEEARESALKAVKLLRAAAADPDGEPVKAWKVHGEFASELWNAGQQALPLQMWSEAAAGLETASPQLSNRFRLELAQKLVTLGRADEAAQWLPRLSAEGSTAGQLLALQASVAAGTGRWDDSLAAFQRAFQMESVPHQKASLQASVADVFERMGKPAEAEEWARAACNVLVPEENPEAATALIALAKILWKRGDEMAEAYLEEGLRIVSETPSLTGAAKLRVLDRTSRDLERQGFGNHCAPLRAELVKLRRGAVSEWDA